MIWAYHLELGIHELVLLLLMNSSFWTDRFNLNFSLWNGTHITYYHKILDFFFFLILMIHGSFKMSLYLWQYNIPPKPIDKYINYKIYKLINIYQNIYSLWWFLTFFLVNVFRNCQRNIITSNHPFAQYLCQNFLILSLFWLNVAWIFSLTLVIIFSFSYF